MRLVRPSGPARLAHRRLGTASLTVFLISASGPMTVLVGGVVTAFAVTGDIGTPLSFPVLAVGLGLFAVGYGAMSRHVVSAGGFYPYVARGLGRCWAVATSVVAVVAYNAVQTGLVGLFGAVAQEFARTQLHVQCPWWILSFAALVVTGLLGVRKVDLNARVLFLLLACEIGAVVAFVVGSLAHPADGSISFAGLSPDNLFVPGVGGVFALGIAGYLGFEQGAVYSEETTDPKTTVARATCIAVAITAVLYTVSSWALTVRVGPDRIVASAQAGDIPFSLLKADLGPLVEVTANALLVTSVFACMLSIHHCVARYIFAMSRDHILPPSWMHTGKGSAAPVAGSLIQSLVAGLIVSLFAVLGRDPIKELFTWLCYVSAVGILVLMTATSVAVVRFFRHHPQLAGSRWQRSVAPSLATAVLIVITGVTVANANAVLQVSSATALAYALPGLVAGAAVVGLGWGLVLRHRRPEVYARIGQPSADVPSAEEADSHQELGEIFAAALPATTSRAGGASSCSRQFQLFRRVRALHTIRRLRPLWSEVHRAVPDVALLPQYRGLAALRSTLRHAPLAAIRVQVEILDGYAALAPWMSEHVLRAAYGRGGRLRPRQAQAQAEAAVLTAAIRARAAGMPALDPSDRVTAFTTTGDETTPEQTLARLVRVSRLLRRPVTRSLAAATTPPVPATPPARIGAGTPPVPGPRSVPVASPVSASPVN